MVFNENVEFRSDLRQSIEKKIKQFTLTISVQKFFSGEHFFDGRTGLTCVLRQKKE